MSNQTETKTEAAWQASQHLSPKACNLCRGRHLVGKPVEHEQCAMRAVLAQAPDHPAYDDLMDLTYEQRQQLPARFHVPVWDGDGEPNAWLCAVCWHDWEVTAWPCAAATKHGGEMFERS